MTQTIQTYPVYTRNNARYCWIQDGEAYWAMNLDPTKTGRLLLTATDKSGYARDADAEYTLQDLAAHAPLRQQAADAFLARYFGPVNNTFRPMQFTHVIGILEAEFISALVAQAANEEGERQGALDTRVHTARQKLFYFWKRHNWNFDRFGQKDFYRYSLQSNFVGETAHIRGCHTIYNTDSKNVRYHCTSPTPGTRFESFMEGVPTYDGSDPDAKTLINETLLAPRTVEDPVRIHKQIYNSFAQPLTQARKDELVDWVGRQFPVHDQGVHVVRVGVWVRRVDGDAGHTVDQNMSRQRFERILEAARAAGVHEVILLGDGWPDTENWLDRNGCPYSLDPGPNRAHTGFLRLWENTGIPDLAHADPRYRRGYAEQALIYSTLYRNPDNVDVNMSCIITNKSGGPDLPSLAGVPQIQIAEFSRNELFVHHRMGFQSLCSPMWTVLRVPQRNVGDEMTLTVPEVQKLTTLIQRGKKLREWHMTALGMDRYRW